MRLKRVLQILVLCFISSCAGIKDQAEVEDKPHPSLCELPLQGSRSCVVVKKKFTIPEKK